MGREQMAAKEEFKRALEKATAHMNKQSQAAWVEFFTKAYLNHPMLHHFHFKWMNSSEMAPTIPADALVAVDTSKNRVECIGLYMIGKSRIVRVIRRLNGTGLVEVDDYPEHAEEVSFLDDGRIIVAGSNQVPVLGAVHSFMTMVRPSARFPRPRRPLSDDVAVI